MRSRAGAALPVAIGISVFLVEFCPPLLSRPIAIAVELLPGVRMLPDQIFILGLALAAMIALHAFLAWSRTGIVQQIIADNGTNLTIQAAVPAGAAGQRFVRLKVTAE